ncbi:ABC transporter substrate-binding protein [Geosporobacter ferrireducens]|uniref:Peptide ABC transporter substrate-binding protein n=1 Tax=Geosporobacter ferrireducens TaxID=1424294 RepID=A0A1D8GM02_9FIRM|nr:ABC transporter substrate-binding protein [Geosporobacter ferrireducens]AOT71945.1 peptide ABC transporter substrate-binding protein [Geosporobacter ferrireducens]MTI55734.1 ABC transporter substrate-binding protein [Geosporobacter ferrireducens]
MFKKVMSLLLVLGLLLSFSGCAPKPVQQETPEAPAEANGNSNPKTITIAINADMGTLDPGVTMDNMAWKITYPTYERLVDFDGASTEVKPGVAKEWKVSEDGLTWTFYLEEGHKFADGTEVNAEAVKFSFERVLSLGQGPSDTYNVIGEVVVEDTYTVIFKLQNPFPPFLSTLAANYGGIVNPKVMEKEENGDLAQNYLAGNTAGSGVYQLEEWKKGQYIKLSLNPNVKTKPAFETVYFKLVADASGARLQLEKGDIDIAEGIQIDQIEQLKGKENITVIQEPSLFVDYVYVNSTKGNTALTNPKVRQAISYAVDYKVIVEQVMQGYATQMRGPIPDGLWGHDPSVFQYEYNVEKAKALLQEAGVDKLDLTLLYSDRFPNWEQEALIMQANLADIGITLNLNKVAYATMREMLDKGDFDLAMGVWSPDYADPFMFMNYWFDSNNHGLAGNRAFYLNKEVDNLVREAATISEQAKRIELYNKAQSIVVEEAPYIYLYQRDFVLPISKGLKGFVYNPMLEGIYNLAEMSK